MHTRTQGKAGFTLIELVVVVAIIAALAGVLIPIVFASKKDAQVAKVLQVVDTLRDGCMRYVNDTGQVPIEDSTITAVTSHQLSISQVSSVPSWKGPYIDHPLGAGDNPLGGTTRVLNSLTSAPGNGFNLTNAGAVTNNGPGNYLVMGSITQDIAQSVDNALDSGLGGNNWTTIGRVKYVNGTLYIFILDKDG